MGQSTEKGNLTQRWVDSIFRLATGDRRLRRLMTPLGGGMFFGFVALLILAALGLDRLAGLPRLPPAPIGPALGWPVLVLGLALTAWSVAYFARARGTPVPFNPPPTLITGGPYAHARNPMLTGLFVAMTGLGLALGSPSLLVVFTPLFVVFNVWELKHVEEPELERRLGPGYAAYRRRVPMFLPRLKPDKR